MGPLNNDSKANRLVNTEECVVKIIFCALRLKVLKRRVDFQNHAFTKKTSKNGKAVFTTYLQFGLTFNLDDCGRRVEKGV